MKIHISFEFQDQPAALEIARACDQVGVDYKLDERNDWLMHGLRKWPEPDSLLVVVASSSSLKSWWLPFLLGRCTEQRIAVAVYQTMPKQKLPIYLEGERLFDEIGGLGKFIRASASNPLAAQAAPSGKTHA